ncbi:helix-turn-helix transcriptional regulator [Amycolatopsis sp. NPDC051102]|uniref:helix-turn-helix domain-containing protein n=1 Tax=Amycolatopsis sp. NPDC051102 TaxID=3155163 RepID=UPI00342A2BC0
MSARDRSDEEARLQKAFGAELRLARIRAGLTTRTQLCRRLREHGFHFGTEKTIASWEQGRREIGVVRLIHVCNAMNTSVADLLQRVERRLYTEKSGHVLIDLHQLANTDDPLLQPLCGWARSQAPTSVNHRNSVMLLPPEAVVAAARQCGLTVEDITDRLRSLDLPTSVPASPDGVADSGEGRLR